MLASEVSSQVQRRFGDALMFLSESDILAWINEAQLMLARESDYFSVTGSAISVSTYLSQGLQVATNVLIKRVMFGSQALEQRDYNLILAAGSSLATGRPSYWYPIQASQDQDDVNAVRNQKIGVWPIPDTGQTDSFQVTVGTTPTPLVTITSPIDAPETFHPAIMNFCLMRAHERNRDWQAMKMAEEAFNQDMAQRRYEGQQVSEDWIRVQDVMGY